MNSSCEIFQDPETKKYLGFAGKVTIYDEEIFIDTRDGKGFDKALKKFEKLTYKFIHQFHCRRWFTTEDAFQDIQLKMIEGFRVFDPRKEVKLSTFIQMRLERRLINQIRDENCGSQNASRLNLILNVFTCKCGNSFDLLTIPDEKQIIKCKNCDSADLKRIRFAQRETYLDDISGNSNSRIEEQIIDIMEEIEDKIILKHDFENYLENLDQDARQILEFLVLEDLDQTTAADKLGISNQTVHNKLKKIRKSERMMELMGK